MSESKVLEQVDVMVWFHLAKLKNLAAEMPPQQSKQAMRSIERIIAILSGEGSDSEPESPELLARVAAVIAS